MNEKQYYAYKSALRDAASYSLLPLTETALYIDGMFDAERCLLLLLTKATRERFQMVPEVNAYGQIKMDQSSGRERVERRIMQSSHEHYISDLRDILWFASEFIVNGDDFANFVTECFEKKASEELEAAKEKAEQTVNETVNETV